jgi:hypothetical protein
MTLIGASEIDLLKKIRNATSALSNWKKTNSSHSKKRRKCAFLEFCRVLTIFNFYFKKIT